MHCTGGCASCVGLGAEAGHKNQLKNQLLTEVISWQARGKPALPLAGQRRQVAFK